MLALTKTFDKIYRIGSHFFCVRVVENVVHLEIHKPYDGGSNLVGIEIPLKRINPEHVLELEGYITANYLSLIISVQTKT